MFHSPHLYSARDYLHRIDGDRLDACNELCNIDVPNCDDTMEQLCNRILDEHSIERAHSANDLVDVYVFLREVIHSMLPHI